MPNLEDVYSRQNILAALQTVNNEVTRNLENLSLDEFYTRPEGKWSAFDTVRHLMKVLKVLNRALLLPKFVLLFQFGKNKKPSRPYAQVKEAYLVELRRGAQAGQYAPYYRDVPPTQEEAERLRHKTLVDWQVKAERLVKRASKWIDFQFDLYQLPHPILGKITVREMLLFTIYHHLHHLNTVKQRVRQMQTESGDSHDDYEEILD